MKKEERLLELLEEFKNEWGTIDLQDIDFNANVRIKNCKMNSIGVWFNEANHMVVSNNKVAKNMGVYGNKVANHIGVSENEANQMSVSENEVANDMYVYKNEAKTLNIHSNKEVPKTYTIKVKGETIELTKQEYNEHISQFKEEE